MRKPPTGEPCAGEPHARFGGRGRRKPFPTPIEPSLCKKASRFLLSPSRHQESEQLFIFLRASAGPRRAITIIGNASDGVAAIDVKDCSGYVTRAVRS